MADKKEKPKKEAYKLYTKYEVSGDSVKRKNSTCPKCGPGMFLAHHKNRTTCGKCGYSEIKTSPQKESDSSEN